MKKVDQLGHLLAQVAALNSQVKELKGELVATGESKFEGDFFNASVSHSERATLDMKAVRGKLTRQFIAAHTKTTDVVSVRTTSR